MPLGTIVPSLVLALLFALALRESTRAHRRAAHAGRAAAADPAGRGGVAVHLHLPAGRRAARLLPGADSALAETNWLGDPSLALGSIIAITVWKNTGYYMLFFLAGLAGVPQDLLDAAKIDGAGRGAALPAHHPAAAGSDLAFVLVIALLNALTQVDHVIVMTQGGPSDATSLLLYYIYQQAHQNYDIGLASAATVVSVGVPVRAVDGLVAHARARDPL